MQKVRRPRSRPATGPKDNDGWKETFNGTVISNVGRFQGQPCRNHTGNNGSGAVSDDDEANVDHLCSNRNC